MFSTPSISFDSDGVPRVTMTNEAGSISFRCTVEDLALFSVELREKLGARLSDPVFQQKIGAGIASVLKRVFR